MTRGYAQALDCRTQLRLAGEQPQAIEERRAIAQYQPAVHPRALPRAIAQKTLNRLLEVTLGALVSGHGM